ncbi:DUF397 domain-containing protein [Streptomyces sp. NPDC059489]|uniref:DUF397 domain-containing protein n=1 Tax=Streptomyces sp. NPDC059489 TaxID=3346849 RepID=UPI00367EDBD9
MNAEDATYGEANLRWHTSSCSKGSGGECVEVALTAVSVYVRDSKVRGAGLARAESRLGGVVGVA